MSMTMLSTIKCFLKTPTICTSNSIKYNKTSINSNRHFLTVAIPWAFNLTTIKWKFNPSLKGHSSHILNRLTNNITKRWILLSSAKS